MRKRIDTTREVRQKAMKLFGITERTLFNALTFDSKRGNSDKAKRIRSYVLQNGGVAMVETPEVETIHDADGYMRQYFPNGAMIEVNKKTGNLSAYFQGTRMMQSKDLKVKDLSTAQEIVSGWTKSNNPMTFNS